MNKTAGTTYGSFKLDNGFINDYYSFTDGEISVAFERNGGINTINCLDILDFNGKLYPDRGPTPIIFRKEGNTCGKRPSYGPAVQFISTSREKDGRHGRNVFHVPDRMELFPFGFKSMSQRFGHRITYDMTIDGRNILFALTNRFPNRNELVLCIDKNHIYQGQMFTLKNQLPDVCRASCVDSGGRFAGYSMDYPFKNERHCDFKWDFIGFSEDLNGFVMEGVMKFSYGHKNAVVLLTADSPLVMQDTKYRYLLATPWAKRKEIKLCLVVAESRNEANARKEQIFNNYRQIVRRKISQYTAYAKEAPTISAKSFPVGCKPRKLVIIKKRPCVFIFVAVYCI